MREYEVRHQMMEGYVLMTITADDEDEAWESIISELYLVERTTEETDGEEDDDPEADDDDDHHG